MSLPRVNVDCSPRCSYACTPRHLSYPHASPTSLRSRPLRELSSSKIRTPGGSPPLPPLACPYLKVGELNENFRRRMLNFELLENRRPVVGDGHVSNLIHKHLIQALGPEGRPEYVGDRLDRGRCTETGARENKRTHTRNSLFTWSLLKTHPTCFFYYYSPHSVHMHLPPPDNTGTNLERVRCPPEARPYDPVRMCRNASVHG